MHIIDRGWVFDASTAPASQRVCWHTSALALRDGRVLVSFRAGSAKDSPDGNLIIRCSADAGATWETVCEGFDPLVDGVPGSWRKAQMTELAPGYLIGCFMWVDRSRPELPLGNPETEGVLPTRLFVMESHDAGHTWTDRREVNLAPFAGVGSTGPILQLADGALAVQHEAWKNYYDTRPGRHHAVLRISHDGGWRFEPAVIVAHDPSGRVLYWDQRHSAVPETGQRVALFWTHDRTVPQDLNIHLSFGSADGRRWTPPADIGIAGQHPYPLALGDGVLLAAYVHRHDPPSLRAVSSRDLGQTWDVAGELVFYGSEAGRESGIGQERDFADYWRDMLRWTFGHPHPVRLIDGTVFVAFYGGDAETMSVHWVRIAV